MSNSAKRRGWQKNTAGR